VGVGTAALQGKCCTSERREQEEPERRRKMVKEEAGKLHLSRTEDMRHPELSFEGGNPSEPGLRIYMGGVFHCRRGRKISTMS